MKSAINVSRHKTFSWTETAPKICFQEGKWFEISVFGAQVFKVIRVNEYVIFANVVGLENFTWSLNSDVEWEKKKRLIRSTLIPKPTTLNFLRTRFGHSSLTFFLVTFFMFMYSLLFEWLPRMMLFAEREDKQIQLRRVPHGDIDRD